MAFTNYANSALRANILVFGLRALQVIFAVTILGVAADDTSIWSPRDCHIPPKLAFNLAAVSIRRVKAIHQFANHNQGRHNDSYNPLPLIYYRSTRTNL